MNDKSIDKMLKFLTDFDTVKHDLNSLNEHIVKVLAYHSFITGLCETQIEIISEQEKVFTESTPPPAAEEKGIQAWRAKRDSFTINERHKLESLKRWLETLESHASGTQSVMNNLRANRNILENSESGGIRRV